MEDKSLNRAKGIIGENEADVFLQSKGFKIIEKNWSMGKLEVDLIGTIGKYIVFVEVKKDIVKRFVSLGRR